MVQKARGSDCRSQDREGLTSALTFLGIEVDYVKMELRLPLSTKSRDPYVVRKGVLHEAAAVVHYW